LVRRPPPNRLGVDEPHQSERDRISASLSTKTGIEIVPFTGLHWQRAVDAFARFGKGRHPAALNFGDCMTYATAALARQPLPCRGDDFRKTDLELV
jgi:uncharacterized protein with PIN domain